MQLKNIEQGTPEWHEFRKGGIGSSDISILLGSYPFGRTPLSLFEEKTSGLIDFDMNSAMAYGKEEEPKALEYIRKTDPSVAPICAIHDEYSFVRASFDALGDGSLYEIKSPKSLQVLERALSGQPQAYWVDQLRWQLFITGYESGNLAIWDGERVHLHEVERDAEWEENALKVASDFWNKMQIGEKPEAMRDDFIEIDSPKCQAYLDHIDCNSIKIKELQKENEVMKGLVIDEGPGHNFMINGRKIYQKQMPSYDVKQMEADGINVEAYKKMSNPFWIISPKPKGGMDA